MNHIHFFSALMVVVKSAHKHIDPKFQLSLNLGTNKAIAYDSPYFHTQLETMLRWDQNRTDTCEFVDVSRSGRGMTETQICNLRLTKMWAVDINLGGKGLLPKYYPPASGIMLRPLPYS